MPVRPHGLNGISPNLLNVLNAKGIRPEFRVGPFIKIPHDVGLAFAARARAVTAQVFKGNKGFGPIAPFDREFVADGLDIVWTHVMTKAKEWRPSEPRVLCYR